MAWSGAAVFDADDGCLGPIEFAALVPLDWNQFGSALRPALVPPRAQSKGQSSCKLRPLFFLTRENKEMQRQWFLRVPVDVISLRPGARPGVTGVLPVRPPGGRRGGGEDVVQKCNT